MISKKVLLEFINAFPDGTYFLPYEGERTGIVASNGGYHELGFIEDITEKITFTTAGSPNEKDA
jgi:hypothetical protein